MPKDTLCVSTKPRLSGTATYPQVFWVPVVSEAVG